MPAKAYEQFVTKLKTFGGVGSDEARRKNRKQYLLMPDYTDKAFTPRDLTISSYVTKLALQQIKNQFDQCTRKPQVVALPGRLTGEARKTWKLMGLLHSVNEKIDGKTLKDDIRSMTHLHHAVDAAVIGLLAYYIRDLSDGSTWQLLLKRHLNPAEVRQLEANLEHFEIDSKSRAHLNDVPKNVQEQIRKLLMYRRVVQHVPSSMEGLHTEENTRGVVGFDSEKSKVILRQKKDGGINHTEEVAAKLLGFDPETNSKLKKQNGVRVIDQNFGVALCDPEPQIITWHKVYPKLKAIGIKTGKWPDVLRNGMLIHVPEGNYARVSKIWRIMSVKNEKRYMAVDMGFPDSCSGVKRSVNLSTLLNDGMKLVNTRLTGDGICRITSSISTVRPSG
jgi:CRISPR-associated endonuclease Csn1